MGWTKQADFIGQTFNYFTILKIADSIIQNGRRFRAFECQCKCGTIKKIIATSVISGKTKSCGCYRVDINVLKDPKNRKSRSFEYRTWVRIIKRCHNPKDKDYKWYGAKGIVVCEEWRNSFEAFLDHIGKKPVDKDSIDRINGTKGYEPNNVRWATHVEQHRNQSNNRLIKYQGQEKCIAEWAEILKIDRHLIDCRLANGWSFEDAVTIPKNEKGRTILDDKTGEIFYSVKDAADKLGVLTGTLAQWLNGRRPNKTNMRYI